MRGRIGAAAAACGVLALSAGVAQAGIATGIEMDGTGNSGVSLETTWIAGHLTSSKQKCISGRTVKVFFHYFSETGFRQVDTDRSSTSGEFAGAGPTARGEDMREVDTFRIVVPAKKIGTKTCASIQQEFGDT